MALPGHEETCWALRRLSENIIVTASRDSCAKVRLRDSFARPSSPCYATLHTQRVWDTDLRECVHTLRGHTSAILCMDVSVPAGQGPIEGGERAYSR
eukprot:1633717-Pyramimonas_sp.AAC.1